jgi:hypothetical protein
MKKEMELYMCPELGFWIEVEVCREAARHPDLPKQELIARALHEFERVGDAMRHCESMEKLAGKRRHGCSTGWPMQNVRPLKMQSTTCPEGPNPRVAFFGQVRSYKKLICSPGNSARSSGPI